MKNILNIILRNLECPVCLKCGSYFVQTHYFCKACANNFLIDFIQPTSTIYNKDLSVHSFLRWQKNESDSLSELVYLLKTSSSQSAWRSFVNIFESEICQIIQPNSESVLVPIPGTKSSFHTLHFAKEIEKTTGCRQLNVLRKKTGAKAQKLKKADERASIEFEINEEFTEQLLRAKNIYLIDDIVTTGSTLARASETISQFLLLSGQSKFQFTGLALFYRTKSFSQ